MENLTLGQIAAGLALITGIIGGFITLSKYFQKLVSKEIKEELEPVNDKLDTITEALQKNDRHTAQLKEEIILIVKLQQAMTNDLKEKNHLNGATAEALNKLNEHLLEK